MSPYLLLVLRVVEVYTKNGSDPYILVLSMLYTSLLSTEVIIGRSLIVVKLKMYKVFFSITNKTLFLQLHYGYLQSPKTKTKRSPFRYLSPFSLCPTTVDHIYVTRTLLLVDVVTD